MGRPWLVIVAFAARDAFPVYLASFCLWQWVYLTPAIVAMRARERFDRANGVLMVGLSRWRSGRLPSS